ncbi:hypothetical protein [Nocardia shimofusensis]|uniref:hypothetical protein n=1 Tax=Nocardia shimofusensis TaxID=228596 RepID=UPI0008370F5E|nr:hypothetical protein [Nocardia shimofusensis]
MSRRFFVSSVAIGAAAAAGRAQSGRPAFTPRVRVVRAITGQDKEDLGTLDGPDLQLLGPGDTLGFDQAMVTRVEPPAGCPHGTAGNFASIEFADGALPWMFSLPGTEITTPAGPQRRPWLVLIVLREDEIRFVPGTGPLPVIDAPAAALPDLRHSWAWAHIEARVDDAQPPVPVIEADLRTGVDAVISRLICPRELTPNRGWLACVVPATIGGRAAGLGGDGHAPDAASDAWSAGRGAVLPVYYSWRFHTGAKGSFEDLARKIEPVQGNSLPGFGSRRIDVRNPWPHQDVLAGAGEVVTVDIQGALRLPRTQTDDERWTDMNAREVFRAELVEQLDAPAARRGNQAPDRDEKAVAPPLYGSHHTGMQTVPASGWMAALNQQVQFRIPAALGARYIQLEQEFLMARAWEQVGAINDANALLAATELAAVAGATAQDRHTNRLTDAALTQLADPLRDNDRMFADTSLATVLAQSAAPDGLASTAFARLTRGGGALARRATRAAGEMAARQPSTPALREYFERTEAEPPTATLAGASADERATQVVNDPAARYAGETMAGLLAGQHTLFADRSGFVGAGVAQQFESLTTNMGQEMIGALVFAPAPVALRGLRRSINGEDIGAVTPIPFTGARTLESLATTVRTSLEPVGQLVEAMRTAISSPAVSARSAADRRPFRPIMEHPRFLFPIGAELLQRWPEWTLPGISLFPQNSTTLLETNSAFVEALLVGLNQEFNRELRWREFPTDEAGTPFARFWPGRDLSQPEYGEIARWASEVKLGDHDANSGKDRLVLLVRAEVLQRYPGTSVLAVKATLDGRVPDAGGEWKEPNFALAVDERTSLYCFDLDAQDAIRERWLFVLREPMRGTQFGFDVKTPDSPPFDEWADLTWDDVPTDGRGFVVPEQRGAAPPTPSPNPQPPRPMPLHEAHFAKWGSDAADMARIAFQRPFQLAFSPLRMIGTPPQ